MGSPPPPQCVCCTFVCVCVLCVHENCNNKMKWASMCHRHRHQSFYLKIREVHWHIAIERREIETERHAHANVFCPPYTICCFNYLHFLGETAVMTKPSVFAHTAHTHKHTQTQSQTWMRRNNLFWFCPFASAASDDSLTIIWRMKNEQRRREKKSDSVFSVASPAWIRLQANRRTST